MFSTLLNTLIKKIRANLRNSRTILLFVLLAVSCSKSPTDSRTGSLTGTVLLEGQTNHSGITVALYKLAELDTTILRYNREYPNVGFPISQATEFDHRLGEVAAEAKTKKDGSFNIDGVEQGTYNLVAEKAGFGWKYIYAVRKIAHFKNKVKILKYVASWNFKSYIKISNRVDNVPINSNSIARLINNLMIFQLLLRSISKFQMLMGSYIV